VARGHGVDKSMPGNFPYGRRVDAETRAAQRIVEANCIGSNPSTGLPRLLERIAHGAKPGK
jgi:hypothetical protein